MIDIETEVFSAVAAALRSAFPGIWVTGEYVPAPPSFPAVMLIEMSNVPYRRTMTQESQENHADLMYELDVFSNKTQGKKTECKAIAAAVDTVMRSFGFVRTFLNPIPNVAEATIYRITGRYEAIVSKDKVIYRR